MHLAQNWRLKGARYALQAKHCAQCGGLILASRHVCADCQTEAAEYYTFHTANVRVAAFPLVQPAYDELRQAAR